MAKRVTTIQPTLTRFTAVPITEQRRRKVAAYARVSTDHEEQQSSYEAQLDYYTNFIRNHDGWEFVNVYAEMLTTTLIQMHPTCAQTAHPLHPDCTLNAPRAESWVHLSHFRSLSRVHLGALGAHPPGSPEKRSHGVEIQRLRAREENFAITSNWRLRGNKRNR